MKYTLSLTSIEKKGKKIMSIYAPYQGTYLNEEFVGYERAKKFIKEWEVWEKCFPTHVLLWLVNEKIKMKDICGIEYIPVSSGNRGYFSQNYPLIPETKKNFTFTEERNGWKRDHREDAYQYIVPLNYQNVYLSKIFREAILMAYPYLKKYKFNDYVPTCGSGSCDIYIKMPYKYKGEEVTVSLYCPLEALREKNPDMIYQRHFGYNSEYYKSHPESKERILGVLNSQKYKAFCKKVMEG